MTSIRPCGVISVCAALCSLAAAQTTTQLYRYSVNLNTGDSEYRGPITPGATPSGRYYKVERDSLGRILRVARMRDGNEEDTYVNHYTGNTWVSDSQDRYKNGEEVGIEQFQRNSWGLQTREDDKTADGTPTSYWVVQGTQTHFEAWKYTPSGTGVFHEEQFFNPAGVATREIVYSSVASNAFYVDIQLDEHTGLKKSAVQYNDGKPAATDKFTYDGNGDLVRMDTYDQDNVWYSADEYVSSLRVKRLYKFPTGLTQEIRYSYDSKRWLTQSVFYVSGKLLCTLTYDREPDGTVKRTLATGPDGALWAEYPAPAVSDLQSNGQPPGRTDGTIYHTGNWW